MASACLGEGPGDVGGLSRTPFWRTLGPFIRASGQTESSRKPSCRLGESSGDRAGQGPGWTAAVGQAHEGGWVSRPAPGLGCLPCLCSWDPRLCWSRARQAPQNEHPGRDPRAPWGEGPTAGLAPTPRAPGPGVRAARGGDTQCWTRVWPGLLGRRDAEPLGEAERLQQRPEGVRALERARGWSVTATRYSWCTSFWTRSAAEILVKAAIWTRV